MNNKSNYYNKTNQAVPDYFSIAGAVLVSYYVKFVPNYFSNAGAVLDYHYVRFIEDIF